MSTTPFTHVRSKPADSRAKDRGDRDDCLHYHVYRCPVCGYTSARMALWSVRRVARAHEARHGAGLFAGRIYDAEPRRRFSRDDLRNGRFFW